MDGERERSEAPDDRAPSGRRTYAGLSVLLGIAFVAVLWQLFLGFSTLETDHLGSNLTFFLLINLNIIVLMVLGFLVVKNIIKLLLDRKRRILGAQLRTRLVIAFVALALIPAALLFFVSRVIVGNVLQGWFSPQVAASVDGALAVAKIHYDAIESDVRRETEIVVQHAVKKTVQFTGKLLEEPLPENLSRFDFLKVLLEEKRGEFGLAEVSVVDREGRILSRVFDRELLGTSSMGLPPIDPAELLAALKERSIRVTAQTGGVREYLRAYAPFAGERGEPHYGVVTTATVSAELRTLMNTVVESYDDYKELNRSRRLVAQSYLLTQLVVTFFVIVVAIWVGFYLARMITEPIQLLAEGTEEVARGNLRHRIPEIGGDELSILVRSFNTMTADLEGTTGELVERRRYMETVLASVGVGVISIDGTLRVETCNPAAASMLEVESSVIQLPLSDAFPRAFVSQLNEMLTEIAPQEERDATGVISLSIRGHTKQIQVTISKLLDGTGAPLGYVILLDDLTELVQAQRTAAWQEVAKRVAHEIKNPLTPIQLSAQRMQKRFAARSGAESQELLDEDRRLVAESTETIVSQVEALRNLVDEFSQFARMPKSEPIPTDLNVIIRDTVKIFQQAHPRIQFELRTDVESAVTDLDREQFGRALMNILDNAVSAVATVSPATIQIGTAFDPPTGMLSVSIADNGIGVDDSDTAKIFEPYFSRKKGGTGLGLAIVRSIISDHHGFIRVRRNAPQGAIFIIEIPVRRVA